jgi:hypothetical protein
MKPERPRDKFSKNSDLNRAHIEEVLRDTFQAMDKLTEFFTTLRQS